MDYDDELLRMEADELYKRLVQHFENEHKRKCLMKMGVAVLCSVGFLSGVIYVINKINNDNQSGK